MLNIISRSILFKNVSGPKKVVENLIKGLDKLGYPYVINKRLDACKRLWIHDDAVALKKIASLPPEIKVIVGPNLYNLPKNVPRNLDLKRVVYLQPSSWSKECWQYFGFNKCPLDIWPAGIDTNEFKPSNERKEFVLVYFKQRFNNELGIVREILESKNTTYRIIDYVKRYKESDYKALLSKSRYIIWLGRQESQGIALQEAMASGVPILVWDVKYMGYWQVSEKDAAIFNEEEKNYQNTTSAPYFDDSCGIKIKDASELEKAIDFMEKNLDKFQPRKYILENLSLEKQAKEFILLYQKHFGLSYEDGFKERLLRSGDWLNNKFYYIIYLKLKHLIKVILIKTRVFNFIK